MAKKIWAVLLSICLMLSLAAPALAAPIKTSGAASTLKLESVDGSAQLKNAGGKDIRITRGARLYNGYQLATEKASYAFISLDDTKAIKLDASSSSEVFQSGKKLELKVNSGQMFFNVTASLKADESLNIRTSTMVTGVRGTSGWITVVDRFTTQISLLEGTLTITSTDPLTGLQRTITIVGGQTATIVYHGKDKNYESEIIIEDETIRDLIEDGIIHNEHIILTETGLTVESLQEEDVPGFVAVEVKKDKELQKKIEEGSPLSVPEIIGDAQQRLDKDEAAAETEDNAIQNAIENLQADKVDPLFEKSATSGSGSSGGSSSGGSSSGSGNTGDNNTGDDPTDTPSDPSDTITLTNPSTDELMDALSENYSTINIVDANSTPDKLSLGSALSITTGLAANRTLNIQSGTVDLPAGGTTTVDGTLNLTGNDTTMTVLGTLAGNGTINVSNGATLINDGRIEINSTNSLHINNGSTLNNNATIIVGYASAGAMTVDGTVENNGTLQVGFVDKTVNNGTTPVPGSLTVNGTINTSRSIQNNGTMTIAGSVVGKNIPTQYTIENVGTLTVDGDSALVEYTGESTGSCAAIYTTDGSVTVKSGTVLSDGYGIDVGINGSVEITGGTVSADQPLRFSNSSFLLMTGGTLAGGSCCIDNSANSAENVVVRGGTLSTNVEPSTILSGSITFESGTLESSYPDFLTNSLEGLDLPLDLTPDQISDSKYVYEHNTTAVVFREFAGNDDLASAISSNAKSIYLMAGGELTGTSELGSNQRLVAANAPLTLDSSARLTLRGKLEVGSTASIVCKGRITSEAGSSITNNGTIFGGQITLTGGTLLNNETGVFRVSKENNCYLKVDESASVTNWGEFYVEDGRDLDMYGSFTNQNQLLIAGTFRAHPNSTLTNGNSGGEPGMIRVGYTPEGGELNPGIMILPNGGIDDSMVTTNLGNIYISAGSSVNNRGILYNTGTIELGDATEGAYTSSIATAFHNSGHFLNGYSSDGTASIGYLNLLSGEFDNSGTLEFAENTQTMAGGQINVTPNQAFHGILNNTGGTLINHNEHNLPVAHFTLFNDGKYVDDVDRGDVYVMVMNYPWDENHNSMEVVSYGSAQSVLTAPNFTWTGNYVYQLIPCGTDSTTVVNSTPAIATQVGNVNNTVTLDLNGCTLALSQPLVVGESSNSVVTNGYLVIRDNSKDGDGILTVYDYEAGAPAQQVVVVQAGQVELFDATVKLDVPARATGNEPMAPIYLNPFTNNNAKALIYDSTVMCGDQDNTTNRGNGIAVNGANCEITIGSDDGAGSTVSAESDAIDLYGSGHKVNVYQDGQVISSGGSGIAINSTNTKVDVINEGAVVSGLTNGIINKTAGDNSGVTINVSNGGKVSATDTVSTSRGISAGSATVSVAGGTVSVSKDAPTRGDYNYGIAVGSNGSLTISDKTVSIYDGETHVDTTYNASVSGYYGIYVYGGSVTVNSGTVSGTKYGIYDDTSFDTATITVSGGSIVAEGAAGEDAYGIYSRNGGIFPQYDESGALTGREIPGTTVTVSSGAVIMATAGAKTDDFDLYAYGIYNMYYDNNPIKLIVNGIPCQFEPAETNFGFEYPIPDGDVTITGTYGIYFFHSNGE